MELEGVPDKKIKMMSFREALLKKVPDAWRQAAFKPDGSVNTSPEIVLMLRTFMTAGAAIASRDRFDLIGRWADVPKKLSVHTPGPKRRLLTPEDCDGDEEYVAKLYCSMPEGTLEGATSWCRPRPRGQRGTHGTSCRDRIFQSGMRARRN